jgi:HEAT repeat protein
MADSIVEQIAALRDADWAVREDAATILGEAQDARAVIPLIHALRDTDRSVRDAATRALMTIGHASIEPLIECLKDTNTTVQECAAAILSNVGNHQVVDAFVEILGSPNWIVRMHAAKGLGRIRDVRAVAPLIPLLQDKVKAVREDAAKALAEIGHAAVPDLIPLLKHSEWLVRLHTVEALGQIKSRSSVEPLLFVMFNDPDVSVREDAARSLGSIGDSRAVEFLMVAMGNKGVRLRAIEALGEIKDCRAISALIEVIEDANSSAMKGHLQGCGDQYEEEMLAMEAAVKALAQIGDPKVIPNLVQALKNTVVRANAAEGLVAFGEAAIPSLLDCLRREQDPNILYHVRESLAKLGWRQGRV